MVVVNVYFPSRPDIDSYNIHFDIINNLPPSLA